MSPPVPHRRLAALCGHLPLSAHQTSAVTFVPPTGAAPHRPDPPREFTAKVDSFRENGFLYLPHAIDGDLQSSPGCIHRCHSR